MTNGQETPTAQFGTLSVRATAARTRWSPEASNKGKGDEDRTKKRNQNKEGEPKKEGGKNKEDQKQQNQKSRAKRSRTKNEHGILDRSHPISPFSADLCEGPQSG